MNVLFVAGFSAIVRDVDAAKSLYADALGVPFEGKQGDYLFTDRLGGVEHLGLWPIADAASACYGTTDWPEHVPVPQASIEFEVSDVDAAARELEGRGYQLIHDAKTEPWSQVTARLLSPEGLLVTVCHTPWLHEDQKPNGSQETP